MRAAAPKLETEQLHHLAESLAHQLARGREWATPGVQAALQRAVAGLDTGIESASPRLQALLRRLAEELAGGVETVTPRIRERLRQAGMKTPAPAPEAVPAMTRSRLRMWWWVLGLGALAGAGITLWHSIQATKSEPVPALTKQEPATGTNLGTDPDLAAGHM